MTRDTSTWPAEWRRRRACFKFDSDRTRSWITLKTKILALEKQYRSKVKDVIWMTKLGVRIALCKLTPLHLANAMHYAQENKNWSSWILLIVEYRQRLKKAKTKKPLAKGTMSHKERMKLLRGESRDSGAMVGQGGKVKAQSFGTY